MLGLELGIDDHFPIRGIKGHELYYDVWSNIHYGYVGSAAGINSRVLHEAPGEAGSIQDQADYITEQVGIDLWNEYGRDLTPEQLHQAVLDAMPALEDARDFGDSGHILIPYADENGF